jgi:hypothetical protein
MKRTLVHSFSIIALMIIIVPDGLAVPQAAATFLKQQLDAQYKASSILEDGSVESPGTVLIIRQSGVEGVPLIHGFIPPVICKDGQLQKPRAVAKVGAGFFSNLQNSDSDSGSRTRRFPIGEKVYVKRTEVNLKKDWVIMIIVECASCNGADPGSAYKAAISFHFAKGSLASMSAPAVEDAISKVFAIDNGEGEAAANAVQAAAMTNSLTSSPVTMTLNLPAKYVSAQFPSDQLQLNADHTLVLQERGQTYHGTFEVNGNTLQLTITESSAKSTARVEGKKLTDGNGQIWVSN